ncbi:hypothetical protein FSOLCH5_010355 [Fusarium solani]
MRYLLLSLLKSHGSNTSILTTLVLFRPSRRDQSRIEWKPNVLLACPLRPSSSSLEYPVNRIAGQGLAPLESPAPGGRAGNGQEPEQPLSSPEHSGSGEFWRREAGR